MVIKLVCVCVVIVIIVIIKLISTDKLLLLRLLRLLLLLNARIQEKRKCQVRLFILTTIINIQMKSQTQI